MTSILVSALLSVFIAGQNPTNDTIKNKQIDEVTVYSFATNTLPLPTVSIDSRTIANQNFVTPANALQTLPGVSLVQDGSWATSVNIRGTGEQRLLFLSDGDRMQTATDIAGSLSTIDLNDIAKIEVIKGAGAVLYGTGAMGGIVNFIPKRPTYSNPRQVKGGVSGGFNSVNKMYSTSANAQIQDSVWYLGINGSYRTAGNTMTPEGEIANSQFNNVAWSLKGGMKYDENQELLVNYNHYNAWNAGLPGSDVFPATAIVRYKKFERNQLNAEYIFSDISDLVRNLRIKGYTQFIERKVENKASSTATVLPSSLNTSAGLKATSDLYFNAYNTITIGAETWYRKAETSRLKVVYGNDTTVIADQPTPKARVYDAGVFAVYNKILDPNHFEINLGGRLDFVKMTNDTAYNMLYKYTISDGEIHNANITQTPLFSPETNNNFSYSAHFDLKYNPNKHNTLLLSLSSAYRIPSIEERFKYIDQSGSLRVGNPDLKPEKGLFSNLSYCYSNGRIYFKTDVFANYMINLIAEKKGTYTTTSGTVTNNALINTNIGRATYIGTEIDFKYLLNNYLIFNTNASYVRGRDIIEDDFLPIIPPANGYAAIDYRTGKKIDMTLAIRWAAKQSEVSVANDEKTTNGYIVFDYNIHSEPLKYKNTFFQIFGGVNNILDTAYKNHLYNNRGLDFYEPGRNFFAKLQLNW
ncbi:MAG: TonB-dependent receptor [Paludibacter sp.]|nr:TonB-dependent receptor [Paludibacter sp.]